jgi:hypothetical protein
MTAIVQEIKNRRILPALGLYVGSCWVLLQVSDRQGGMHLEPQNK